MSTFFVLEQEHFIYFYSKVVTVFNWEVHSRELIGKYSYYNDKFRNATLYVGPKVMCLVYR
jgi:hypothetical protein